MASCATVLHMAVLMAVIKQRMQIKNSPYRNVIQCAKTVYAREGLTAFYVSYPTTLTMSVPFTAVQFSVYESLKSLLNPDGSYSPLTHCVSGGVAGAVAAAVTTPLDVAKVSLLALSVTLGWWEEPALITDSAADARLELRSADTECQGHVGGVQDHPGYGRLEGIAKGYGSASVDGRAEHGHQLDELRVLQ